MITFSDRLAMLTSAHILAPDIESHKLTARVRIEIDDDEGLVIFSAVRGEYLVAVTAVAYEDFETVNTETVMKGVYATVLEELTAQMDEAWDDGSIPLWIDE